MRGRWTVGLLTIGLVASLALVLLLAHRVRERDRAYREVWDRAMYAHPGMFVPEFEADALDGRTVHVGAPAVGERQVVVFLTTTCPYCLKTVPFWKEIAEQLPGRVVGVQLDSAHLGPVYVQEHAIGFPVVPVAARRIPMLYRVRSVPLTLVVDEDGRVVHARRGEIIERAAADSVVAAAGAKPVR